MTINWLLPFMNLTGGIKVPLEYANQLAEQGHRVRVYYPGVIETAPTQRWYWSWFEAPLRQLKYLIMVSWLKRHEAHWIALNPKLELIRVPALETRFIKPADWQIATGQANDWLIQLPESWGSKANLVQDYESWVQSEAELLRQLKNPSSHLIIISQQLADKIHRLTGRGADLLLANGVNTELFQPPSSIKTESQAVKKIGLLNHAAPHKGSLRAWQTVRSLLLADSTLQIELTVIGQTDPSHLKALQLPASEKNRLKLNWLGELSQAELITQLQKIDLLIYLPLEEGYGLLPLELMAMAVSVITTPVGAMPEYGQNVLYLTKGDPLDERSVIKQATALAQQILSQPFELSRLQQGVKQAQALSLKQQTTKLSHWLNDQLFQKPNQELTQ
ncbi:MAG: group 1 glycosyl transferase [Candidatus Berkelbacteria bacterium Gr01-1014_85]|uniref:Group 1 glycosyl transferase n=1 Tax=Candidatus Berkelbacteria bacterium Gr01-1014_85 TaxID=2017150 RepID=A0A554JA31_9BACT|nr:MAG: group 1 glycosyl transferase [Candidatus Berkelbacteria bacterium Gr01-1014_85]